MGLYKYIKELWKKPKQNMPDLWKKRLIAWRKEPVTVRVERPTRIDRARSLGYRAKQGIFVVRQRVLRGGHKRPQIKAGRRPRHNRQNMVGGKNYQRICEERTSKKYTNCEVLNSYYVAEDGKYFWYEVIMLDRNHPVLVNDKIFKNIVNKKDRAGRGMTSAGKKGRGLMHKGMGAEKLRPSLKANKNRGK